MPKTVMFVHGAWVTYRCWDHFRAFFEAKGLDTVAPPWPYLDRPPAELRRRPDPRLAGLTVRDLVDHFEREIHKLPEPPLLVGHSFGGLIVQLLLDRGLGLAGAAIDPGPPRGVLPSLRAVRSALPVLLSWRGWSKIHTMSFESFAATFANALPAQDRRDAYETHIVPAPGRIYFQAALGLGISVDFQNPKRPPLLLIAGEEDRTSTPSMARAMYRRHRRSPSAASFLSFPGRSHWLIAEPGWADLANAIHAGFERMVPEISRDFSRVNGRPA